MLEKFLSQTEFKSQKDFIENFKIMPPDNFNFAYDVVDAWAEKSPNKKALCWVNDKDKHIDFTFDDMKKYSDMTASYFQSLGIGRGDMVMLMLKRRFEFWYCILALHKLGAVAIPATHMLMSKDIVYRNNAALVKMIVTVGEEQITEQVDNAMQYSPSVKYRVSIGPKVPNGWLDFQSGIENAKEFMRPDIVNENSDISLIYFTSGTTANPKMAAHDYLYPLGHIVTGCYWHNLNNDSLHLTIADTGWGKAVWGKLYGQWIAGANVFVYDHESFSPKQILELVEKYKITSFCAPPTVFRFMIKEDISKFDLSSLKSCTIAGEALNPAVYDAFYKLTGIKLKEGFGQTETTLTVGTFPWVEPKPGSMGVPNPQYKVELLTADGRVADVGEHGQIVIHTKECKPIGLFKEYYREPERTNRVWHNDLYYTGDIAYRDKDGYLWFIGRADDIIKSAGYRISPFEVESVLMKHEAVLECAVTGVEDPMRGQIVKATIVLTDKFKNLASKKLAKDIQDYVKSVTANYKFPRIIDFVSRLPKTISGKIRRIELRNK